MKSYECYLFDADGTILDTTELIVRCFKNTYMQFAGVNVPQPKILELIGIPFRPQLENQLGPLTDARFAEIASAHMAYQKTIYKEHLRACPGTVELVQTLKKRGHALAVVSSRRRPTLELYLDFAGFGGLFDLLVSPEDTRCHKPEPEPVFFALNALGVAPDRTIMIGDAPFDIEAGRGAGTDTAFVLWSPTSADRIQPPPTYVIERPEDLL